VFRLRHILEAIHRIRRYTADQTVESFAKDDMRVDAVIHKFAVIGEAVAMIPEAVREQHPEIPWRLMRGMRNVLVHDYDRVDVPTLWQTVQDDLPPLIPLLERMLIECEASETQS